MKLIYIYSKHDTRQLVLLDRIKEELPSIVEILESEEAISKGYHVRATPCLIPILDSLQGDFLLEETDGQLLLIAKAYQLMDVEEKEFHNVDNARLDTFVVGENNNAMDNYTMELIIEGVM